MSDSSEILTVNMLLGNYSNTELLRNGQIQTPRFVLNFAEVEPAHLAFKRVVRNLEFDVAELAISTFLSAKAHDKPLVLLPIVVRGKFHHESLVCSASRPPLAPSDLAGRRIGIRSHTVTTVTWVRGILQNDYDVDLGRVKWVTFEDAHVEEVRDPKTFERAPAGKNPMTMLFNGELDAAVVTGRDLKDPRVRPVISNPAEAARKWYRKHGLMPINHMVVAKESLLKSNPWAVEETFRLLVESKKAAGLPDGTEPDPLQIGVEATRKSLEMVIKYAVQQQIVPGPFEVDELFDDVTRSFTA
jgi:4,5-dihydroxyphthalate decarboxylase